MFKIKNEGGRAEVFLYGTIGEDFWSPEESNRAKDFSKTLAELSPKPLDIHIDSGGGDVFEGFAIASAIKRYEGPTTAYVDGLAASAASYIALMADRVVMNDFAFIMIHNAWSMCCGNRDDLRKMADELHGIDDSIARIIEARSALNMQEVVEAMAAETWYSGEDAEIAGMCDEVIVTDHRIAASIDPMFSTRYARIPDTVNITETKPETPKESVASHPTNNMRDDDGAVANKVIVLGNRIYQRKEHHAEQ